MFPAIVVLFLSISCSAQDAAAGKGLRFRDFNLVPGAYPSDVNDQGVVAANIPGIGPVLIAADGTITTLGIQGSIVAMNNRGQMLLQRDQEVFLVQPDGTMEPRNHGYGLNNLGQVVGQVSGVGAVQWDENGTRSALRMPPTPLGSLPYAMSINDT
ncbi:MAG: hypothetical protein HY820_03220 [Acidobacteria bacterium]|nr:hypothetical protein [Acidobacteriota bacterium]